LKFVLFWVVNVSLLNTTASSMLTGSSRSYVRYGGTGSIFYYGAFEVVVPTSATYIFSSSSSIDTYGYLYNGAFYTSSTALNLVASDDDSGGGGQFRFSLFLQANVTYILVATTYASGVTGSYAVVVSGPMRVSLREVNNTLLVTSTTTIST
jgi:hypothetical protein